MVEFSGQQVGDPLDFQVRDGTPPRTPVESRRPARTSPHDAIVAGPARRTQAPVCSRSDQCPERTTSLAMHPGADEPHGALLPGFPRRWSGSQPPCRHSPSSARRSRRGSASTACRTPRRRPPRSVGGRRPGHAARTGPVPTAGPVAAVLTRLLTRIDEKTEGSSSKRWSAGPASRASPLAQQLSAAGTRRAGRSLSGSPGLQPGGQRLRSSQVHGDFEVGVRHARRCTGSERRNVRGSRRAGARRRRGCPAGECRSAPWIAGSTAIGSPRRITRFGSYLASENSGPSPDDAYRIRFGEGLSAPAPSSLPGSWR